MCLLAFLLTGCATKELYVVLPEDNGQIGQATVLRDGKQLELRGAYSAAEITALDGEELRTVDAALVQANFAEALAAQPAKPVSYMLYFKDGSDSFTRESEKEVDMVLREISERPAPDVSVIGHTDTVDSQKSNDILSLKRAEKVRSALIERGIPSDHISASGRGERELLVPTADNTSEPRNRRVEISVR